MDCQPCALKEEFAEMKADNVERQKRHVDEMVPFVIRVGSRNLHMYEDNNMSAPVLIL